MLFRLPRTVSVVAADAPQSVRIRHQRHVRRFRAVGLPVRSFDVLDALEAGDDEVDSERERVDDRDQPMGV